MTRRWQIWVFSVALTALAGCAGRQRVKVESAPSRAQDSTTERVTAVREQGNPREAEAAEERFAVEAAKQRKLEQDRKRREQERRRVQVIEDKQKPTPNPTP